MTTPEAGFVIRLTFNTYLLQWICSLVTSGAFVLSPTKHGRNLAGDPTQFGGLSTCLEILAEAACLLEELFKVRLAVKDTIHGRVIAHHKSSFAMATFEARFVIRDSIRRHQIDDVNGLIASVALLHGAGERHCEDPDRKPKTEDDDMKQQHKNQSKFAPFGFKGNFQA